MHLIEALDYTQAQSLLENFDDSHIPRRNTNRTLTPIHALALPGDYGTVQAYKRPRAKKYSVRGFPGATKAEQISGKATVQTTVPSGVVHIDWANIRGQRTDDDDGTRRDERPEDGRRLLRDGRTTGRMDRGVRRQRRRRRRRRLWKP